MPADNKDKVTILKLRKQKQNNVRLCGRAGVASPTLHNIVCDDNSYFSSKSGLIAEPTTPFKPVTKTFFLDIKNLSL